MSEKAYRLSEKILSCHDSVVSGSVIQPDESESYFTVVVNTDNGYILESTLASKQDLEDLEASIEHVAGLPEPAKFSLRSNTKEGFPS